MRKSICIALLAMCIAGCAARTDAAGRDSIVRIVDFELSPDEDRIAFTAVTPVGNTDIWVVNIDGTNLKKLTFKDRSPSNHIARFYKKRRRRNYYEIDMHSPEWTKDESIVFCEEISRYHKWGVNTAALRYLTIKPDGTGKKPRTKEDEIVRRKPFDPINRAEISDRSEKHKKKIFIKNDTLWVLNYGEAAPEKLIQ